MHASLRPIFGPFRRNVSDINPNSKGQDQFLECLLLADCISLWHWAGSWGAVFVILSTGLAACLTYQSDQAAKSKTDRGFHTMRLQTISKRRRHAQFFAVRATRYRFLSALARAVLRKECVGTMSDTLLAT